MKGPIPTPARTVAAPFLPATPRSVNRVSPCLQGYVRCSRSVVWAGSSPQVLQEVEHCGIDLFRFLHLDEMAGAGNQMGGP